ncbi:MAG: Fe-S-cluster-containing dehydrogenase component [Candidatus Marinamargulisbacteria bacterium]|jgi:Fe-S-cluster-containing dehydrogenase component
MTFKDLIEKLRKREAKRKKTVEEAREAEAEQAKLESKSMSRRSFLGLAGVAAAGSVALAASGCGKQEDKELALLKIQQFFQKNYRIMTKEEKLEVVERLEKEAALRDKQNINVKTTEAVPNTLFGYALNLSKCRGYGNCVTACREENNLPEDGSMDYIRVLEMEKGSFTMKDGSIGYSHEVPKEEKYYLPMQCMHCANPPCVPVCPVGATWKENDGIVVVDYDWCVGCRYCEAACPYEARRFNFKTNDLEPEKKNKDQHYLGNRDRKKGVMEKCHFCVHRTREGRQLACAEACPTGARVFGNLLDPKSEIRWIIENKTVFRLKENLNTQPQFYYYVDA